MKTAFLALAAIVTISPALAQMSSQEWERKTGGTAAVPGATGSPERVELSGDVVGGCRSGNKWAVSICGQYVWGVVLGYAIAQKHGAARVMCPPESLDIDGAVSAFVYFVAANPASANEPSPPTIINAMARTYPCKGPQSRF